jgi:hypothetical protein
MAECFITALQDAELLAEGIAAAVQFRDCVPESPPIAIVTIPPLPRAPPVAAVMWRHNARNTCCSKLRFLPLGAAGCWPARSGGETAPLAGSDLIVPAIILG